MVLQNNDYRINSKHAYASNWALLFKQTWYLLKEFPILYYDFGADVTHDSCPTAANFRSIATYFDQKTSTKTSD